MNLYVMRHGLATNPGRGGKDSDRKLTRKGERRTWDSAEAMEKLGLRFDVILSSPYVRARQTAEIVADAFNLRKRLELTETLAPGGDTKVFVEHVNRLDPIPENILLVGHEPGLSRFISLLVSGDKDSQITLKKGGLCKLTTDALRHGRCAKFEWLLTPRQMAAMV